VTFDCYGTLIDWRGGISEAFSHIGAAAGMPIDRDQVLELHARIEPEIQAEEFRSYAEVLDLSADRIAGALGFEIPSSQRTFLSRSLPGWQPFADTGEALEKLASAGYRLGILSNVDDHLLAQTLWHLPVEFEMLVTAEQVGSYKPALGHFREARRRIGEARWLHVAQSFFHDVQPAVAERLPVVWINRLQESPPTADRPTAEFPDMKSFAAQLVDGGGIQQSS
jgi:2-haloalkanoic acid dehalogenase type II